MPKGKAPPRSDGPRAKSETKSKRCGLLWPIAKVNRHLRDIKTVKRVGGGAPVFLSAALEYVVAEILEIAGNQTLANKRKRVGPQDLSRAVRNDVELSRLLGNAGIFAGEKLEKITTAVTLPLKGETEEAAEDAE